MEINIQYLDSVKKQMLYYKTLGEKAINQLEPEQLFVSINNETNSIAVIVKHLSGNMLSRWTDFFSSDGEKEWRNRDDEFVDDFESKEAILVAWNKGWECFFDALNSLKSEQLSSIIYIRNEGHTVLEAINRQLTHYPYHIGQIVFYAKQLKKEDWKSLSIPKNMSDNYNRDKFLQEKGIRNFADDELKRLKNN